MDFGQMCLIFGLRLMFILIGLHFLKVKLKKINVMKKIAETRFRKYYDALYSCTHVHVLVQPYPFFQICLSVLIDCGFSGPLKKRIESLCPAYSRDFVHRYWLYVGSYCLLSEFFSDSPVTSKTFDAQFVRWLSLHFNVSSFVDTVASAEVQIVYSLCVEYYRLSPNYFKQIALC